MPSVDDIIEKMKRQPNGISITEAEKVLVAYGYALVRQRGSHCHYRNSMGRVLTVKKDTPLKAVYVRDILKRIQEAGE